MLAAESRIAAKVGNKVDLVKTHLDVTLGIIFPPVRVSTRSMNGIIDKTL